jgi:hypothetical protein
MVRHVRSRLVMFRHVNVTRHVRVIIQCNGMECRGNAWLGRNVRARHHRAMH